MRKLIEGIAEFRNNSQSEFQKKYSGLVNDQSPDALMVVCSDSRVVPHIFTDSEPGDVFMVQNVGNLIPLCGQKGEPLGDEAAGAAIEFGLLSLEVNDIIVCGHSECGAMKTLLEGRSKVNSPFLKSWLRHGDESLDRFRSGMGLDQSLSEVNQLSQLNVLVQLDHLSSLPLVKEKLENGRLRLHGWWYNLESADVFSYDVNLEKFVVLDQDQVKEISDSLKKGII